MQPQQCPPPATAGSREAILAAMRNARDHGFLWRISKDGRSSYLYGTIHLATWDLMFPGPMVMQAAKASDRFALELDLSDANTAQRLHTAAEGGGSGAVLPEAVVERINKAADRACFSRQRLDKMSPGMQVTTLLLLAGRNDGIYPDYGIDVFLSGFARGLKKPVTSLESPEAQMALIQSATVEKGEAALMKQLDLLEDPDGVAKSLKRLVDIWAGSRFDELQRYPQWCDCAKTEDERRDLEHLLDDRNVGFAQHIDALHEGGESIFAAVGMLHMIGAAALPTLLAARGYQVEFLVFPPG